MALDPNRRLSWWRLRSTRWNVNLHRVVLAVGCLDDERVLEGVPCV
jgi:hypothetical protein